MEFTDKINILSSPNNDKKSSFQNRLLRWFVVITIIPLPFIFWFSYQQNKESLIETEITSLKKAALINKKIISRWFDYRFIDIKVQAKNQNNIKIMLELAQDWRRSNQSLSDYVKSDDWANINNKLSDELLKKTKRYDYIYDFYLIDKYGNILLNLSQESDLGTNIISKKHNNTLFAKTVQQTLTTGETLFSDIERYTPSNNAPFGFMTTPLINAAGKSIGVFALQIKLDRIYRLLDNVSLTSVMHYVVNENAQLQTPIRGNWQQALNQTIYKKIDIWQQEKIKQKTKNDISSTANEYIGIEKNKVIGIHQTIKTGNIYWLLISEVNSEDAFSELDGLTKSTLLLLIVTALIIISIAAVLAKIITRPIKILANKIVKIAYGENSLPIKKTKNDEIGQLTDAFNFMLKTRQQQQNELKEKAKQLTLVVDTTGVGIWDWNLITGKVECNQHWFAMLGYQKAELQPFSIDTWTNLLHPDDLTTAKILIENYFSNASTHYTFELRMKHKSGHWIWLRDSGKLIERTKEGKPKRMFGIALDISEKRNTESNLARSEVFAQGIFNSVADGIINIDTHGAIQTFNPAAEKMYGYSQEELKGKNITNIMPPAYHQPHKKGLKNYIATKKANILNRPVEVEGLRKDGSIFPLELTVSQVNIGDEIYFTSVSRDITLRQQQGEKQQKLYQSTKVKLLVSNALSQATSLTQKIGDAIDELFILDDLTLQSKGGLFLLPLNSSELYLCTTKGKFIKDFLINEDINSLCEESAQSFEIIIRNDRAYDHGKTSSTSPKKSNGYYIIPLIDYAENMSVVLGTLFLYTDINPDASEDCLILLKEIGALFSTCIIQENARSMLKEASRTADQNSRLKSEFLASMSHEIRTPMNGVLGMLGLLLNSGLNSEQTHKASLAKSSAESLLTLINDILDVSKVEAGKMSLEYFDFNLRSMLAEVAESMALKAQDKGLEVILDITEVEQSMVKGDKGRIRQILTNLVGNAIKFTKHGEIIIRVATNVTSKSKLLLHCIIEDTGIGIPENQMPGLFDSFSQVDASTTRQYGGTGLGLSISKKLCELMTGDINVSSIEGKGSTFEFSIVIQPSKLSQKVMPSINVSAIELIIVDDNTTSRQVLRAQLEHWGVNITEAKNAKDAIIICEQRLKQQPQSPSFDLALVDMTMPDMDGIELGKYFRQNHQFDKMKMVMMASIYQDDEATVFADLGFNGFFTKPATTSDLFYVLALVDDDASQQSKPEVTHDYLKSVSIKDQTQPSHVISTNKYHWPKKTRLLIVEDNRVNQIVALGILEKFELTADIAKNGLEAIQMLALTEKDDCYALVLMDCQMPEMDGYQATKKIRLGAAGKQNKSIPIIAMTANAMQGDKEKCIRTGMNDYLSKPLEPELLVAKLNTLLIEKYQQPVLGSSKPKKSKIDKSNDKKIVADAVRQQNEVNKVWDKKACLKRVRNSELLLHQLITLFIEDMPEYMNNLNQAICNNDFSKVHYHANTIKGIAGNLSALQLQEQTYLLELAAKAKNKIEIKKLHDIVILSHQILMAQFTEYLKTG
jgi:PAS domain S-box-containing protein